jgi:hypothetical protein
MAGRAIRTRPLDNHKPLDIIRDETLLDSTEGLPLREAVQSQAAPDAAKEKVSHSGRRRGHRLLVPAPWLITTPSPWSAAGQSGPPGRGKEVQGDPHPWRHPGA